MPSHRPVSGLWCALLTPLDGEGGVDHVRLARHAASLLAQGVDGVAPFGTTGEGQSFSLAEREAGLDALLAAGIPAARIVAATGCAALTETVALTRHGVAAGCAACLVLPPFFFKDLSDEGLYAWYARVIEAVADPRLRVLLYHIPQVTGVAFSPALVERLATAFPDVIVGVKDSGGDWANTAALLQRFPQLAIFAGHEPHLPRLMRAGGAGTICGVANVLPGLVRALLSPTVTAEDEARIRAFLDIVFRYPLLPAFKCIVAERSGDPGWRAVRPPLVALHPEARRTLLDALAGAGVVADAVASG